MTKPLYFYNGSTFELVGPTTPQSPIAYQTSAPTAPATGDLWIDSDGDVDTYNRQLTRYYFVATASQTTITGIDANGLTLAYVAGSEAVYVNGALQVRGQDYTATNGTSVVLSSGLAVNDVVEIFAYTAFTVANAYTKSETDGIAAAAAGMKLIVPSSVTVGSGSGSVSTNGTVTFSGASSISVNDVFSSTYKNYVMKMNVNSTSGSDATILLRMRVSGADNSSANYFDRFNGYTDFNATDNFRRSSQTGGFFIGDTDTSSASLSFTSMNVEFRNPYETLQTTTFVDINDLVAASSAAATYRGGGLFYLNTSFTGFTTYVTAGNITGTIAVYGYKD